ncbi:MAG: hypothetical protein U0M42_04055 [Acutalibacteraceae bacterium]|nr:hypothetical protein [Acutalibacteraceae bacterium]
MKKFICLGCVVLILVSCLSACNFTNNMSGALAGEAECKMKVEEMLSALSENRLSDAKSLMHPEVRENADTAIAQMSDYLVGKEVTLVEQKDISVTNSSGTSGKTKEEKVVYQLTLSDGDVIFLNVYYFSNKNGIGFASFQIVLGVVQK